MAKPPTGMEEDKAPFERSDAPASPARAPKLARPTSKPVDLRALHDEIAADFPKTLARLAE